jgi:cell division septation protein DedD
VRIDGEDARTFDVAAGLEPSSPIDLDAVPEAPLPRAPLSAEGGDQAVMTAPAPAKTTAPVTGAPKSILPPAPKVAAQPADTAAEGNYGLQLGAFSSGAKADAAWKQFTSRYSYLAPLQKQLQPLNRDGKTLYRLIATGVGSKAQADSLCAKMRIAGDTCMVVQ